MNNKGCYIVTQKQNWVGKFSEANVTIEKN